jgi:hypothetical protein
MSRIPFHATGRPYAGKHGRFHAPAPAVPAPAPEPVAADSVTPEPEPVAAAPEPEPVAAAPEPVAAEPATPEPVAAEPATPEPTLEQVLGTLVEGVPDPDPAPTWDASWTKAQLLVVAQTRGLPLTMANTKAEIVAGLTAG